MTKNNKTYRFIKLWGTVALAALLYAVAIELFLFSSTVVVGGATGMATLLDIFLGNGTWLNAGVFVILLNVPIIIYCFARRPRRLAVKTTVYVLLLGAFIFTMRMLNWGDSLHQLLGGDGTNHKMLYTLIGGGLSGVSLPLMLSVGGSTGGSDIVGMMLQSKNKSSSTDSIRGIFFANIALLFGGAVVMYFISGLADAVNLFIYSIAAIVVSEIVHERMFHGFSSAIELEITTTKPEEMTQALIEKLKHGVTYVKAVGGYSGQEKTMILCVIYKRQLTLARRIIGKVDANAFAYVENVREVIGRGFVNKEDHILDEQCDTADA